MMVQIHKQKLDRQINILRVKKGSEFLCAKAQGDYVHVWYKTPLREEEYVNMMVRIVATGEEFNDDMMEYGDTVISKEGHLVLHILYTFNPLKIAGTALASHIEKDLMGFDPNTSMLKSSNG